MRLARTYQEYVEDKKTRGEEPLSKEKWESRHAPKDDKGGRDDNTHVLEPKFREILKDYKLEVVGDDQEQAAEIAKKVKEGIEKSADICQMSPPICKGNMGLTRDKMPQIPGDMSVREMLDSSDPATVAKGEAADAAGADPADERPILRQMLDTFRAEGVKVEPKRIPVGKLKATQSEIKASKTFGMADAHLKGNFPSIADKIVVSRDGYILDGHHRWAALLTISPDREMSVLQVGMDMEDMLERADELPGVYREDFQGKPIALPAEIQKKKDQYKGKGKPKKEATVSANFDPSGIGKVTPPAVMDPNTPILRDFDQRNWSELSDLYGRGLVGDEQALESSLARLASEQPHLRPHLVPLLAAARDERLETIEAFKTASFHFPAITAQRWASLTGPEKYAVMKRVAHKPILESQGLDKAKVNQGEAFMVYKIDAETNASKFYEGLVVPYGSGFRVIRRWGALTDSGQTGRIDGAKYDEDPRFYAHTLSGAKRILQEHYANRMAHGYIDAFGPEHVTPDGKRMPMGQYPVGLSRAVGFGWGSQSVTQCIPALFDLVAILREARDQATANNVRAEEVHATLGQTVDILRQVTHADSTMGQKLMKIIGKPYRRLGGSPRFLPDPEGRALARELGTIVNYVRKQLSYCGR